MTMTGGNTPSPDQKPSALLPQDEEGTLMDYGNSGSGSGSSDEEGTMAGLLEVDDAGGPVGMNGAVKRADGAKGSVSPWFYSEWSAMKC